MGQTSLAMETIPLHTAFCDFCRVCQQKDGADLQTSSSSYPLWYLTFWDWCRFEGTTLHPNLSWEQRGQMKKENKKQPNSLHTLPSSSDIFYSEMLLVSSGILLPFFILSFPAAVKKIHHQQVTILCVSTQANQQQCTRLKMELSWDPSTWQLHFSDYMVQRTSCLSVQRIKMLLIFFTCFCTTL